MKAIGFLFILCFILYGKFVRAQEQITDGLIRVVIKSIYPTKSYLKLTIAELPSMIYSKANWENENEMYKYFVLKVPGFDSLLIANQLSARENINVDKLFNRQNNKDSKSGNIREIRYILFSKDLNSVIIKEMHYCGEDCGSDMTILYNKNEKGEWVIVKSIFGGIY